MAVAAVPEIRLRTLGHLPVRRDGRYVLYWMTAFRRSRSNFALQHAVALAETLQRPLLVLEALRCDYPWASPRLHRFVIDGMRDNAATFAQHAVAYYPYVEPNPGAGHGLLSALAAEACAVIGDDAPLFFLPRMLTAAAAHLPVRFEVVDSNGLLPLRAAERDYPSAYAFRRLLQRQLPAHLAAPPAPEPLAGYRLPRALPPQAVGEHWPVRSAKELAQPEAWLAELPLDRSIAPVDTPGGAQAAGAALAHFVTGGLPRYVAQRNQPEADATSGLSPYLHFGQLSAHEVFAAIARWEAWHPGLLDPVGRGQRHGWWGMSENAEAFLDQLVTWRELGYNFCTFRDDAPRYDALPEWARASLENHADDPRPYRYTLAQFDDAATHDPLWNAAQRQLRREGTIHNYLRMLWGKKILEWAPSPQEALAIMIELNNRYALDGRDPNSYSGISWCLGRYDRPWPERPVFGKVRSMSSASTARKVEVRGYLERYAP